jgi:hypothetical protein
MSLTDDLEKLGEPEVRRRLVNEGFGQAGSQTYSDVQEWLRGKDNERNDTPADTDAVNRLAAILRQKAHEADRKLGEAISSMDGKLRDTNAFAGPQPVAHRKTEYEKDIEYRRDALLSTMKQIVSSMNAEQRRKQSPELNDFGRRWLGEHLAHLQEELHGLATRLSVHDFEIQDLGSDRFLAYVDAELQLILSNQPVKRGTGEAFIDPERLSQLKSIKHTHYDLSRLLRLCEELDIAYAQECYYAVAMLTRSILDHIPPIFNAENFAGVANNYSGGGRSFKEIAQQLENASRKVADAHLHTQIRQRESLPTRTQVDVRQQMDFVLAEVVRVLTVKP